MNDRELVRALKALADETRFRIVQELAKTDELSVGDIVDRFDLSQPTISHHLKLLLDAKLIVAREEGKHRYVALDRAALEQLGDVIPTRLARKKR